MKKDYKNRVFNLIKGSGLEIESFIYEEHIDKNFATSILSYRNTPFSFCFYNPSDSFDLFKISFIKFSPGFKSSNTSPDQGWIDFIGAFKYFDDWIAKHLKEYFKEQNEIDLWEAYKSGNKALNLQKIDFDNKSAFSTEEKSQIRLNLEELKYLIQKNLNTTTEEQKLIVARLDYLIDASNRLNRFDWKSVTINTIISISIALSLDTEKGQILFNLFKKVFGAIQSAIPALQQ